MGGAVTEMVGVRRGHLSVTVAMIMQQMVNVNARWNVRADKIQLDLTSITIKRRSDFSMNNE